MSLPNWLGNGWLTEHNTSPGEIGDLLAIADRDLDQALTPGLSPDWRLNIAYNAALQAAVAALAAAGYRSSRANKHYRVIQSLVHTIGMEDDLILVFDHFRKKRNISDYERAGTVSEQEADEMYSLAKDIRSRVETWLKNGYPELL
ncbi:hypothetical protein AAU61_17090 [Desulfocarbo indianensis]|nr:hypothetical protein AAU61_17090 [Desulfocarbo indianensis]